MNKVTKIGLSALIASAFVGSAFADNHAHNSTTATTSSAAVASKTDMTTATAPKDNSADASYTIGYSVGKNMITQLKQQKVDLNLAKLQSGFEAGVKGDKPELTQEQMEQAMQSFQKEMEAKMKAQQEAAQKQMAAAKDTAQKTADASKATTATTATTTS
ncbi:FKBP-type peptidyl-prolyl cis-trans isomerase N-terminal domain-containing protein [Fangia hongkongensis]|uniref:FKBP-type peptidyl-prolyl cis-trans isomerase N-terminal domain-containing protein n=1 Tax=Fangia hongkongensis TaxID=270495 RepID=UPI00037E1545|nr:FKBP-type peptidyl-prolyl cis-trans isomerase N-terminal domain-containing protein [Fangia hongkongensis]MBK2125482.1 hypothetical protein [Fangia hongkongensis]